MHAKTPPPDLITRVEREAIELAGRVVALEILRFERALDNPLGKHCINGYILQCARRIAEVERRYTQGLEAIHHLYGLAESTACARVFHAKRGEISDRRWPRFIRRLVELEAAAGPATLPCPQRSYSDAS